MQSARIIRFTNVREIVKMEPILKAFIYEAIEVEKAGLKVKFKKNTELIIPEEFQNKLDEIPRADALKIYGYAHVWIKGVLQSDYKRVACVKKTWQVL